MATATASTTTKKILADEFEPGDEISFTYTDADGLTTHRAYYHVEEVRTGSEESYAVCISDAGEYRRFRLDRMAGVVKSN